MCGSGCRIAYHHDYKAPNDGSAWTGEIAVGVSSAAVPGTTILRSSARPTAADATVDRDGLIGFRLARTLNP
jgi:hypothetical protein